MESEWLRLDSSWQAWACVLSRAVEAKTALAEESVWQRIVDQASG